MALLCSCGNGTVEELSETGSESVSAASADASETTVMTTSAETTSEAVSEETEIVTEVSEAEKKEPVTRDFFNYDVVFEKVMLPVKVKHYNEDGTEEITDSYEYDEAGNRIKWITYTSYPCERIYEYDYNPDGTYNGFTSFFNSKTNDIIRFDENGYCIEITNELLTIDYTINYEYEFDETGRLIRKSSSSKTFQIGEVKYTYDEAGRLYEEFNKSSNYGYIRRRHEYIGSIENVYFLRDEQKEEKLWKIIEKDENGNKIKETVNADVYGVYRGGETGKVFIEYKYDDINRLIYENHTVSDDYVYDADDAQNIVYLLTYEYEEDKLKKESRTFSGGDFSDEYFYSDNGSMIMKSYVKGVLKDETEYAMIPKIKTDIEYKYYMDIKP